MAATDQMPKPNNALAPREPSMHGPRTMANDLDRSMLAEWVRTGPEGIEPSSGRIEGMNARSAGRGGRRSCWPP